MNLNNLNLNEKIEDLLAALKKKEDEKEKNTVLWVLAIIGAVAAVAGIVLLLCQGQKSEGYEETAGCKCFKYINEE